MIRAILCRIGGKPRTIYLGRNDDHVAVAERELRCRGPVARLPLLNGIELRCDRNGLLLGLGLARRAMAAGLRALSYPRREPPPSETRPRDGHDWDLDVDLGNWVASGDFLLVRVGARGELVDLTNADLGLWEILLGLDYLLHR
jgi:hypothetical protein